jgi:hypothetical protein
MKDLPYANQGGEMVKNGTLALLSMAIILSGSSILAVDYDPDCLAACRADFIDCRQSGVPMDGCIADFEACNQTCVLVDYDNDGIWNRYDNCVRDYNPEQYDWNNNGVGDKCDPAGHPWVDAVLDAETFIGDGDGSRNDLRATITFHSYFHLPVNYSWVLYIKDSHFFTHKVGIAAGANTIPANGSQVVLNNFVLPNLPIRDGHLRHTYQVWIEFDSYRYYWDDMNWYNNDAEVAARR